MGIGRRITLKWILWKLDGSIRTGVIGLEQGAVTDCCVHGCESNINCGSFLTNWETLSFWRRRLLHEVSFVHIITVVPPYSFMCAQLFVSSLFHVCLSVECFITIQFQHMNSNLICSIREEQKIYRNFLFVLPDLLCIVFSK